MPGYGRETAGEDLPGFAGQRPVPEPFASLLVVHLARRGVQFGSERVQSGLESAGVGLGPGPAMDVAGRGVLRLVRVDPGESGGVAHRASGDHLNEADGDSAAKDLGVDAFEVAEVPVVPVLGEEGRDVLGSEVSGVEDRLSAS